MAITGLISVIWMNLRTGGLTLAQNQTGVEGRMLTAVAMLISSTSLFSPKIGSEKEHLSTGLVWLFKKSSFLGTVRYQMATEYARSRGAVGA